MYDYPMETNRTTVLNKQLSK